MEEYMMDVAAALQIALKLEGIEYRPKRSALSPANVAMFTYAVFGFRYSLGHEPIANAAANGPLSYFYLSATSCLFSEMGRTPEPLSPIK